MSNSARVDVAVVGATGAVGEAMLEILAQRQFPVGELYLLASERSAGEVRRVFGRSIQVTNLAEFDFTQVQLGLFSPGGAVSAEYAPKAAATGCYVIDNTSHFRRDPAIPLVVPEVNAAVLDDYAGRIIANPNCSTIQMLVALKPIYDAVGIARINVATYQAVSGAGAAAIRELAGQTAALLGGKRYAAKAFPQQIAFNAIPQIGEVLDNGYSLEEMKMLWETQKIFDDPQLQVNATCVRVPVFYGHSEAVALELGAPLTVAAACKLLRRAPGVKLLDNSYPTAIAEAAGNDPVYVGRVRADLANERGLNLWIVSDNLRKGAALNSIQIAEYLLKIGALD